MTGTGAWNGQTWQELLRDGLAALEITDRNCHFRIFAGLR